MKRQLAILLSVLTLVATMSLAACGGDETAAPVIHTVVVEKEVVKEVEVKGDTVVVTATAGAVPVPTVEPEKPAPTPKGAKGTLTFASIQVQSVMGLNSQGWVPKNIFPVTEDLFVYDFDGNREALQLAESWDLAEDLSHVDITIKEGIPWQGGGHGDFGVLTAHDVAYSYNDANPAWNPVSITDGGGFWSNLIGKQEVIAMLVRVRTCLPREPLSTIFSG